MNFVGDLLALAEETEIADLKQQVPILKREIHRVRSEILEFFDRIYAKNTQISTLNQQFVSTLKDLQEKHDTYKKTLEGIRRIPVQEEKNLSRHLKESSDILQELQVTYSVHELLLESERYFSTEKYCQCLEKFKKLSDILSQEGKRSNGLKYFQKPAACLKTDIIHRSNELILKKYKISMKEQHHASFTIDPNIQVENLITTLLSCDYHIDAITDIIEFLYRHIFFPIVTSTCKVTVDDENISVKITKLNIKQNYVDVFKHFHYLLNFFETRLESDVLIHISTELSDQLTSLIISECLDKIETLQSEHAIDYESLYIETELLENDLQSVNLVQDGSLKKYVENLREIHINKSCQMFINDTTSIIEGKNELVQSSNHKFQTGTISKEILKFLDVIERQLVQMSKNVAGHCKLKKFDAVLSTLDYYKTACKYKNEKDAQKAALFHNNCQLIVSKVKEWNILYAHILNKEVQTLFKDEAFHFQVIGQEVFNTFVKEQTSNLQNILMNNFVFTEENTNEILDFKEESLTTCFETIKYLKDNWQGILTQELLDKTVGFLLDVICDFFVKSILECEVLKDSIIKKLRKSVALVMLNIETFFPESTDLKYIKSWNKFKTLNFVLHESLNELQTELINKNCTLRKNFKAGEIEILIKVLFENSKERELCLSTIYE